MAVLNFLSTHRKFVVLLSGLRNLLVHIYPGAAGLLGVLRLKLVSIAPNTAFMSKNKIIF